MIEREEREKKKTETERKRVTERERERNRERPQNSEIYYTRIEILGNCLFFQSVLDILHANTHII